MISDFPLPLTEAERLLSPWYRADDELCLERLLPMATFSPEALKKIQVLAAELIQKVRERRSKKLGLDAFLSHYDLSSKEGLALMCLAEAFLRIPDKTTQLALVRDKLSTGNWAAHASGESSLMNTASWGLGVASKLLAEEADGEPKKIFKRLLSSASQPMILKAVDSAMKMLGGQFVIGETIEEAIKNARASEKMGYTHSYDMLGEAARTAADAERYFLAYQRAIHALGEALKNGHAAYPGISIKLSALHPRYEVAQKQHCIPALTQKLRHLAIMAKEMGIPLTVDAEEANRLTLSLEVIEAVFSDSALAGWEGFGLAVQAYQKRAFALLDWLEQLAKGQGRRLMVRLVKGAYWDSEIKMSQVEGLNGYPVFTRKAATDVSYLACARKMIRSPHLYPQFATHNALTVASILHEIGERRDFEFQCLYGMGSSLYDHIVSQGYRCRVYAPVGGHEDLLAYLVRRLLENGANSSFVNRILDEKNTIESLLVDPAQWVSTISPKYHPHIPLPVDLYGGKRRNSIGFDWSDPEALEQLRKDMNIFNEYQWVSKPSVSEHLMPERAQIVTNPATAEIVGQVMLATEEEVELTLARAQAAFEEWNRLPVVERAIYLRKFSQLLEKHQAEFLALLVREAGKNLPDAIAEVREAIDFCRYYAIIAEEVQTPKLMPGPTGEHNELNLMGRGVAVCISPWNFPLAIFLGQVTAALVVGNTVVAKPASQTPLVGARAIELLHEAGVPRDVIQLLPGSGRQVGMKLVKDARVQALLFTGSTETARLMNQTLANRPGPIIPFIAETGGQNAMISDSSALPEQLVADVIRSAFSSAGQRCSALRVLFVQKEVADKILTMLAGAMAELSVGDPRYLSTDVGPVIDVAALEGLEKHKNRLRKEAKLIAETSIDKGLPGTFCAPCAFEIDSIDQLEGEVFGPILHVIRYSSEDLEEVTASINRTGFGLTGGIHSRIESRVEALRSHLKVGNLYVNRNMIGAVVGTQPFGGEGLSGTGPKAGGPHYLNRLCVERTISINTTASGGNTILLSLLEE